jgi:hypothetical protein
MNTRTSVVVFLAIGFGVALAIKSCGVENSARTAANGPAPVSVNDAEQARRSSEPISQEPVRSVAPTSRAPENPAEREAVEPAVLIDSAPNTTEGVAESPPLPMPTTEEFEAESKDPAWSVAAEGQILGDLSRIANLALVSAQVDCRTTVCRIHLTQPRSNPAAFRQLVSGYDAATWAFSIEGNALAYLKRSQIDARRRQ